MRRIQDATLFLLLIIFNCCDRKKRSKKNDYSINVVDKANRNRKIVSFNLFSSCSYFNLRQHCFLTVECWWQVSSSLLRRWLNIWCRNYWDLFRCCRYVCCSILRLRKYWTTMSVRSYTYGRSRGLQSLQFQTGWFHFVLSIPTHDYIH